MATKQPAPTGPVKIGGVTWKPLGDSFADHENALLLLEQMEREGINLQDQVATDSSNPEGLVLKMMLGHFIKHFRTPPRLMLLIRATLVVPGDLKLDQFVRTLSWASADKLINQCLPLFLKKAMQLWLGSQSTVAQLNEAVAALEGETLPGSTEGTD